MNTIYAILGILVIIAGAFIKLRAKAAKATAALLIEKDLRESDQARTRIEHTDTELKRAEEEFQKKVSDYRNSLSPTDRGRSD